MSSSSKFTFIDLFAGIGGFHIAMHNLGGECVFASEKDPHARKTYEHNFKKLTTHLFEQKLFNDDIRNVNPHDIPNFDVLCAGFPCQPFSQAGYKLGFNDNRNSERGNLFFNIAEIIEAKRPKAFFLENVRGIVSHDNGRTFKIIRQVLEEELGYSFYYKVVKASDYGLPQLRPRAFMIGFRDESFMKGFSFPPKIPLKYTMSDVWEGDCSREIGFTLRVGGRGSKIDDRRNWDAYLVDGEIKQLGVKEGKKMQGFPENYEFPVSNTQAIKQLGNSVAIDAVKEVAKQMLRYMENLDHQQKGTMQKGKNKGEWTELLVFIKLLAQQKLHLADKDLNQTDSYFNIHKVTTRNLNSSFFIVDSSYIDIQHPSQKEPKRVNISELLSPQTLQELTQSITSGKGRSFQVPAFQFIQDAFGFHVIKGGTSQQKADILLDISNDEIQKEDEGFGIKSYLGSKPTLLNASGNTNFIFEVLGLDSNIAEEINQIATKHKLIDRLSKIEENGGELRYIGAERSTMEHNLKMIDSLMPQVIGHVLLCFFKKRISSIKEIVEALHEEGKLNQEIAYGDRMVLEDRIKRLLVAILLGFFAGNNWDGKYKANGTIVMKNNGDMLGFHIIELENLKEYLYEHIKLDTPSTTRHRYGMLYKEQGGKLYFKLNMQLRF